MLVVVEEADRCALESRKRTSGPRHKLPRYWSGCSIQSVPCPIWVDNVITYIRRGKPKVGHLASCLCMSLVSSERATGSESKQSVLLSPASTRHRYKYNTFFPPALVCIQREYLKFSHLHQECCRLVSKYPTCTPTRNQSRCCPEHIRSLRLLSCLA